MHDILVSIMFTDRADKWFDSKKMLKEHLPLLAQLIKKVVLNIPPEKKPMQGRDVHKLCPWQEEDVHDFCGMVFGFLMNHNLSSSFLKYFKPEERASCRAEFRFLFLDLERKGKKFS